MEQIQTNNVVPTFRSGWAKRMSWFFRKILIQLLTRAEYTLHGRWCHAELDSASIDPETSSGW